MTTRVNLLCHASTTATRKADFPSDEGLDRHGREALEGFDPRLGHPDRCWAGPSLRTRETAEILQLQAAIDPRLDECIFGRWAGQAFEAVHLAEPDGLAAWLSDPAAAPHGGESVIDLLARVAAWLDEQRAQAGRVIAVTHASVIRAAVVHAIGAPPHSFWRIDVAPLSVTRLSFSGRAWTLAALGTSRDTRP